MPNVFARTLSMEAPMPGLEFTNRANTVPVWRLDAQAQESARSQPNDHSSSLKRSHSHANPPLSPFDPEKSSATLSKPVFGGNLHYLFRPPEVPNPFWNEHSRTQPLHPTWGTTLASNHHSQTSSSMPFASIPDVDMQDIQPWHPQSAERPRDRGGDLGSNADHEHDEYGSERQGRKGHRDSSAAAATAAPRPISNVAVRRVARRRVKEARGGSNAGGRAWITGARDENKRDDDEEYDGSDTDEETSNTSLKKPRSGKTSNHYTLNLSDPAQKEDLPYVLLAYTQFLFVLSLALVFLYLLVKFIFTVQQDVEQRVTEYSMDILQEISTCAIEYKQNLCDSTAIPAMLHQCATWETCMSRDPKIVGRARVGAGMLAEVVNSFVEPISWKTLLFTLSSLAFMTVFVNALLSLYRSQRAPHPHPNAPPMQHHSALPGTQIPYAPSATVPSLNNTLSNLPHTFPSASSTQSPDANGAQGQHLALHSTNTEKEEEDAPRQRRRLDRSHSRQ